MHRIAHLEANGVGIAVDLTGSVPEILHVGPAISRDDEVLTTRAALPGGELDEIVPFAMITELAAGYVGRSSVEGRRLDGSGWAPCFHQLGQPEITATAIEQRSVDPRARLELRCRIELDSDSTVAVLRAWLTNVGDDPYLLNRLALTIPAPPDADELLRFGGRWGHEFHAERMPWASGSVVIENRRGRTSHDNHPTAFVGRQGFGDEHGSVLGVHLGWSGNGEIRLDRHTDGRRTMQVGELLFPGDVDLEPGATYATPPIHVSFSSEGLNGIRQAHHAFLRGRDHHPRSPRPVILNTWEAVYWDHDLDTLERLADRAASVGVERFVLDDGWFLGRKDDTAGLGDWIVDPTIWPDGLTPLIDHITSLGMDFGLWVEPEMVNPDSELFRHHPDWVLAPADASGVLGRNQMVLDLVRPEVSDHLFNALDALLDTYEIAYLKWDANRDLLDASHFGRAAVHRQTLATYELMRRIREAHPGVEIESCASGGGRADFGVLEYTDRLWTSDTNDALDRQGIHDAFSLLFPPELMGAHVGPSPNPLTGRRHSVSFRGATALFGHMGVEWDLLAVADEDLAALRTMIDLHKELRPLLHTGRVYRYETAGEHVNAHGVVAHDLQDAVVSVVQLATASTLVPSPLRIAGLDPHTRYEVRHVALPDSELGPMRRQPGWLDQGLVASGRDLALLGVPLPVLKSESALLLRLHAV